MSTKSYDSAFAELKKLLTLMEEDQSVDKLAERVKKAQALITSCKEKLRNVEKEVEGLVE